MDSGVEVLLTSIAAKHLDIETLRERGSDQFDFHEVAVWHLRDALEEAYQSGKSRRG
jgi:hypothetical protein